MKPYKAVTVVLIFAGVACSLKANAQYTSARNTPQRTLDGAAFLATMLPGDAKAIQWINANIPGQPTILEAVGESYQMLGRIATFTGLPAVLAWPTHEWLWRGSPNKPILPLSRLQRQTGEPDTLDLRRADVRTIYETEDVAQARALLDKYQVEFVYIGGPEVVRYPALKEAKFRAIAGDPIYRGLGVRIYKIPR